MTNRKPDSGQNVILGKKGYDNNFINRSVKSLKIENIYLIFILTVFRSKNRITESKTKIIVPLLCF